MSDTTQPGADNALDLEVPADFIDFWQLMVEHGQFDGAHGYGVFYDRHAKSLHAALARRAAQPVEGAGQVGELRNALRLLCNTALPVTNAAYNMGQSHEQWFTIKAHIDALDAARRAAFDLIHATATHPSEPVETAVGGALVASAEKFDEIRHLLNETFQFASTSPAGKRNINEAIDLLDEIESTAAPAGALVAINDEQTQAARDVLAERRRQVEQEGWTPERDDKYVDGELASAAVAYAQAYTPYLIPRAWPWSAEWFKPADDRRNLVKAGALIVAEIERLDRATLPIPTGEK